MNSPGTGRGQVQGTDVGLHGPPNSVVNSMPDWDGWALVPIAKKQASDRTVKPWELPFSQRVRPRDRSDGQDGGHYFFFDALRGRLPLVFAVFNFSRSDLIRSSRSLCVPPSSMYEHRPDHRGEHCWSFPTNLFLPTPVRI